MTAIYKKEMSSYFHSLGAYLFYALFLAASGIYFSVICMTYGYTDFAANIYSNITILYIVVVPVLTMRLLADEKKLKTDRLLLTSPVRIRDIILGKYLAVLTLLSGTIVISLLEALVLSFFGKVNWQTIATGALGYFLLGACFLAVGLFISALSESPMIAGAVSFGAVLICMLLPNLSGIMPERARYTYIICVIAILLIAIFIYHETKRRTAAIITVAAGAGVTGLLSYLKSDLFDNGLSKIIDWFSVLDRFEDFTSGVLNASAVIYYLSFIIVFLMLALYVTGEKGTKGRILSSAGIAVMLAVVLFVNFFAGQGNYSVDVTTNRIYTLSDQTEKILKNLDYEVNIYVLNNESDTNAAYQKILNQYKKGSHRIKLTYKDPDLYPGFARKYINNSSEEVKSDSLIVVCGEKYRYLSSDNFVSYDFDGYSYSSGSLQLESQLTEAINYVISEETPVIYTLTGHAEKDFSTNVSSSIEGDNFEIKTLNLLSEGKVPEDCEILVINGMEKDISKEEAKSLESYMAGGGKMYIFLDAAADELPRLYSILEQYDLKISEGVVVENDSNHYYQLPIYLLPKIESSDVTSAQYDNNILILAPSAKGITQIGDAFAQTSSEATSDIDTENASESGYTITPLLTTTEQAFSKVNPESSTMEKEKGDIDGPFNISVAVSDETGGRLIVTGCSNMLIDNIDQAVGGANSDFVLNGINYLAKQESKISIRAKSLTQETAVVPAFYQKLTLILTVFVLPVILLLTGIAVMIRRRRL